MIFLVLLLLTTLVTACPPNCQECFNNSPFCIACSQGFELSLTIACIPAQVVPQCSLYTNQTHCERCQPSFDLVNNTCVKEYSGCINIDRVNRQCFECYFGKLLVNGTCRGALQCSKASQQCQTCTQGWTLQSPTECADATGNCLQISQWGVCQQCKSGFKLVGYQCVPDGFMVANCYIYEEVRRCVFCKDGYSQIQGECLTGNEIVMVEGGKSVAEVLALRNGGVGQNNLGVQTNANNQKSQNVQNTQSQASQTGQTTTTQTTTPTQTTQTNQGSTTNNQNPQNSNQPQNGGNNQQVTPATGLIPPGNQNQQQPSTGPGAIPTVGLIVPISNGQTQNQPQTQPIVDNQFQFGLIPPNTNSQPSSAGNNNQQNNQGSSNPVVIAPATGQNTVQPANTPNLIAPQPATTSNVVAPQPTTTPNVIAPQSTTPNVINPNPNVINPNPNAVSPPQLPNCLRATPSNNPQCLECMPSYIIINSVCVFLPPLCQSYNPNTGECTICKFNLALINSKCIDPNCQTSNQTHCTTCSLGFTLNASTNLCEVSFANCLIPGQFRCHECLFGYFMTIEGQCQMLPANCQAANMQTKLCIQCVQGYEVNQQNQCQKVIVIPNCLQVSIAGTCQNCIQGFYPQGAACIPASPFCGSYNQITGICITCISGYSLVNDVCVDPNCQSTDGQNICIKCVDGYYLDGNTPVLCKVIPIPFCMEIDPNLQCILCIPNYRLNQGSCINANKMINCQSFSNSLDRCTTCLPNYQLQADYSCVLPTVPVVPVVPVGPVQRDINCKEYNGSVCVACSNRFYFSSPGGKCIPVSSLCKNYSAATGQCESCYPGYFLTSAGTCIVQVPTISNCQSESNGVCSKCYSGFFLNQGNCQPLNPLCKNHDFSTGACTDCYPGYTLGNGLCTVFVGDPNCLKTNPNGGCLNCSRGFFLDVSGRCKQVNPLCNGADSKGLCIDCYPGYTLVSGACIIGRTKVQANCFKVQNGVCTKCFSRYYLNTIGECQPINPLCKTFNPSGACTSCYPGYSQINGECLISGAGGTGQQNCAKTDANNICTSCYKGYYLSASNTCLKVNDLCKTRNTLNTICTSCYDGYELTNQGGCVVAAVINNQQRDPYCMIWDLSTCIECVTGFYLPAGGNCKLANALCKTVDSSGFCSSCYLGYTLSQGNCQIEVVPTIPFCQTVVNSICTACIQGYYPSQGECAPVSILCGSYDRNTGVCTSCRSGYVFQGGECIRPSLGIDVNCKNYGGSYCAECLTGYKLKNYWCVAV